VIPHCGVELFLAELVQKFRDELRKIENRRVDNSDVRM